MGGWTRVEESDFNIYSKYWDGDIPENLPAMNGYRSGGMKDYQESDMTPVEIHLQAGPTQIVSTKKLRPFPSIPQPSSHKVSTINELHLPMLCIEV